MPHKSHPHFQLTGDKNKDSKRPRVRNIIKRENIIILVNFESKIIFSISKILFNICVMVRILL